MSEKIEVQLPEQLKKDAEAFGIQTAYHDARGTLQVPSEEAVRTILGVLTENAKAAGVTTLKAAHVIRKGHGERIENVCSDGSHWRLTNYAGERASGGCDHGGVGLPQDLPIGSYQLVVSANGQDESQPVLVSPAQSFQPGIFHDGRRVWALAAQLYSLRSQRNWGIGDFSDLKELVRIAGDLGAAGVGLNPLHAINLDNAEQISPYSPGSRLFLNPLYIDIEAIPEFPGVQAAGLADEIARLRAAPLVDYAGVIAAKLKGLRLAYEAFRERGGAERQDDFSAFKGKHKPLIDGFAAFAVLHQRFGPPWWNWPEEWRRPSPEKLEELWRAEAFEMDFHCFVQWVADRQLRACRDIARKIGMPIGLYLDVAVGVTANGSDVWSNQGAYVRELSAGRAADMMNTAGQDWGLASFHPGVLASTDFALFRDTLRAVMRHAGAIRLDHVLGFNRLYLIPQGYAPNKGTYVTFPLEAMLAVVAQESNTAHCVVVGEDLGTVPDGFRERLADWNVWCYRVMLFERKDGGVFKGSAEYPKQALVSFGTHDLATFSGWMSGHDLAVKRGIGLDPGETDEERADAHRKLAEVLKNELQVEQPTVPEVTRFLARTPSPLLVITTEDVFDVGDQANVPGTINEHPNWRRRLPVSLEDYRSDQRLRAVADVLRAEGRAYRRYAAAPAGDRRTTFAGQNTVEIKRICEGDMTAQTHLFLCMKDNYGVLLHDPETGATASIDAPEAGAVEAALAATGWKLSDILVTHHHGDHTAGIPALKARHGCKVTAPAGERAPIANVDVRVKEGDAVKVGTLTGKVLETPGHTAGHIAYFFAADKLAFVGDTLFSIGCGRLFEGTAETMWNSLAKLRGLPDDTMVFCGHEYTQSNIRFALGIEPANAALKRRAVEVDALIAAGKPSVPSRLGEEKAANPFLRADVPEVAAAVKLAGKPPAQVFGELRERKNNA